MIRSSTLGTVGVFLRFRPQSCIFAGTFGVDFFFTLWHSKKLKMKTVQSWGMTVCACKQLVMLFPWPMVPENCIADQLLSTCHSTRKFICILEPLRTGPIGCPETSVRNYHYSPRNNQEERDSNCSVCKIQSLQYVRKLSKTFHVFAPAIALRQRFSNCGPRVLPLWSF